MIARYRAASMGSVLLLAVGVAACGGSRGGAGSGNGISSKSAAQIVKATTSAAASAKSVEAAGSMTEAGSNVALDLKMVAGVGATGWLSEGGERFNLVLDGRYIYINAGRAFWKAEANAAAASLLAGRWLKAPTTGSYAAVAKLATLRKFFGQVFSSYGTLTKTAAKTIRGVKVIGVRDAGKGGVLYVATTGKPYPIELDGDSTGSGGGRLSFSNYGKSFTITAPSRSISLAALAKLG